MNKVRSTQEIYIHHPLYGPLNFKEGEYVGVYFDISKKVNIEKIDKACPIDATSLYSFDDTWMELF